MGENPRTIKERGEIKGNEVDSLRNELSIYQKTINLIGARIDQMPAYVKTRQKITDVEKIDNYVYSRYSSLSLKRYLDSHRVH